MLNYILELYSHYPVKVFHSAGVAVGTHFLTLRYFGNPLYHVSGALSYYIGSLLDHISTIPYIELANTPKFKELGLHRVFEETSPILGSHPSMRRYLSRSIPIDLLMIGVSLVFPPLGYSRLSISPIIFLINRKVSRELEDRLREYI